MDELTPTAVKKDKESAKKQAAPALPPAQSANTNVRYQLPPFRVHVDQIPEYRDILARFDEHGNPLPTRTRTGGQFSMLRITSVNTFFPPNHRNRVRVFFVPNSPKSFPFTAWGMKPSERLSNPPGMADRKDYAGRTVTERWRETYGSMPFPESFASDANIADFLELCYGVVEVLFEFQDDMNKILDQYDLPWRKSDLVDPLAKYDTEEFRAVKFPHPEP